MAPPAAPATPTPAAVATTSKASPTAAATPAIAPTVSENNGFTHTKHTWGCCFGFISAPSVGEVEGGGGVAKEGFACRVFGQADTIYPPRATRNSQI